jgi:rSAM/selenodomain-associated transferase 1
MADRLALFVRAPLLGRVKTRLAADIGPEAALDAHRQLTLHALRQLSNQTHYSLELWCSRAHQEVAKWSQQFQVPMFVQNGADLGERMANALGDLCRDGGRGAIVGCDCPLIDADYVHRAFLALDAADLVLGPAEDGGYGLIAWAGEQAPAVFGGVAWGSAGVLAQTRILAEQAGLAVSLQPQIWDVDSVADWHRFERDY